MSLKQSGEVLYYSFPHLEEWPQVTQAVLGRLGGVSEGLHASLNLSYAVGDDPERVLANRKIAANAVGWEASRFVSAKQVHGRKVARVTREMAGGVDLPDTDVLVTGEPGVMLMLKFADCVPITLWDPVHRVIALAHAGWRGTVLGAPAAAVETMVSQYGSRPGDIVAGIGPSIGPCCYQVGPEVEQAAQQVFSGTDVLSRDGVDEVRLDLWAANAETLMRCGLPEDSIVVAGICTKCRSELFFSHRALGGNAGRFGAVVGLSGE